MHGLLKSNKLLYTTVLLLLFLIHFSNSLSSDDENTFTLVNISPGLYAIALDIGYPTQNFLLLVDTSSKYTWVRGTNCTFCSYTENIYEEEASISAIHQDEITYTTLKDIKGSVSGNIILDDIKLGDYYAPKIEILVASEDEFLDLADGVLSLRFPNNENNERNLINKLFKNGFIRQKVIYFNIIDEMSATLMLGRIPNYINNDKHGNYSTCHINHNNNNWNCLATHILFDSNYNFYQATQINTIINFSTGISRIYVPLDNIDLFIENYFKKFPGYDNKKCTIKKLSGSQDIFCLKSFLNFEGPPINFIINGYAYQIPFEDLFDDVYSDTYNNYKLFKVEFTQTPGNEWYLGTVFLKQYETVFDAENMQVGFYGGKKYDFTKYTNENYEKHCWYNSISICFLFSLVLVPMAYTLWTKKKESSQDQDSKAQEAREKFKSK